MPALPKRSWYKMFDSCIFKCQTNLIHLFVQLKPTHFNSQLFITSTQQNFFFQNISRFNVS